MDILDTAPVLDWVAREALVGEQAAPPVLVLGEDNPYGSDPSFALYCYPPRCSGYNLRRIFGLPEQQYLALHRANLCDGPWSAPSAKERAQELLVPLSPHPVIVMLGRKVTEAMRRAARIDEEIVPFSTTGCCPGLTLVSLPHPSGRNAAMWNPKARDRAREIMRELVPALPWGSIDAEEAAA